MSYPKWVQRAPHIGAVLVHSEAEEKELLDNHATEQTAAQAEVDKAVAAAAKEAEDLAKVDLPQSEDEDEGGNEDQSTAPQGRRRR